MKLSAFRDRIDDERKNFGLHHALDAYRIVAMMTREEFDLTQVLVLEHSKDEIVDEVRTIISREFDSVSSRGVLQLVDAGRLAGVEIDVAQGESFVAALADAFGAGASNSEASDGSC